MEDEAVDTRYEFEERNGRRLRYFAGKPGNYVGVTEYKGKHKTSFNARASITKRKGDARRQYAIGSFPTAVAAAMAIADAEQDPLGPPSPEGERKPRTCVLPAHATRPLIFCMYDTWLRLLLCSQPTNASSIALASTGPSSRRILPANNCSRGQWCSRHALPRSRCLLRAISIPPLSFRSSSRAAATQCCGLHLSSDRERAGSCEPRGFRAAARSRGRLTDGRTAHGRDKQRLTLSHDPL